MARARSTFRQTDVMRAIRAAERAGLQVARVEIDTVDGKISLMMVSQPGAPPAGASGNEWDGVK